MPLFRTVKERIVLGKLDRQGKLYFKTIEIEVKTLVIHEGD